MESKAKLFIHLGELFHGERRIVNAGGGFGSGAGMRSLLNSYENRLKAKISDPASL